MVKGSFTQDFSLCEKGNKESRIFHSYFPPRLSLTFRISVSRLEPFTRQHWDHRIEHKWGGDESNKRKKNEFFSSLWTFFTRVLFSPFCTHSKRNIINHYLLKFDLIRTFLSYCTNSILRRGSIQKKKKARKVEVNSHGWLIRLSTFLAHCSLIRNNVEHISSFHDE